MYLLGCDIGSSAIKVSLVEAISQKEIGFCKYPEKEMEIISPQKGWAEQEPEKWWEYLCIAIKKVLNQTGIDSADIQSVGIAYQMHGLVLVDQDQKVLRPSIIWCDSRAVEIGEKAYFDIGENYCHQYYLNSPGNFTASKLKWVKENEPSLYEQIHKLMLPGDYIAMKFTGEINTTVSGLSEGILWNFKQHRPAQKILNHFQIQQDLIPDLVPTFGPQGYVQKSAGEATGLKKGTPITYRAGDQPNNALSLGVINANEVVATGGTSGVIFALSDKLNFNWESRINIFAHVNHQKHNPRLGHLLCINGAGIQYAWLRKHLSGNGVEYKEIEELIRSIPVGADGLRILPFGNGAERMFDNRTVGAQINNLQFNKHQSAHLFRAALEGIAFSFVYGFKILEESQISPQLIKVGTDNLFQSQVFSETIATLTDCPIQLINTTGADGAAKASGFGAGIYSSLEQAFDKLSVQQTVYPKHRIEAYKEVYHMWKKDLEKLLYE